MNGDAEDAMDEMIEFDHIRGLMANPSSPYWKGASAEGMQARYRELLAKGHRTPAPDLHLPKKERSQQ
jgi:hypothetical protein